MRYLATAILLASIVSAAPAQEGIQAGTEFPLFPDGPGRGIQATPAVAYGDGVYLVAWREGWHGKGGSARIFAARVSAEGKPLDAKAVEIAPARQGVQESPRVAFGGGVFLVVWQDLRNGQDYDVLGARVNSAGKVLDQSPLSIGAGPHNQVLPDVASDGTGFVVVWQGIVGAAPAYHGLAASVSAEGRVSAAVETGMTPQPRLAWSGSSYLAISGGIGTFAGSVNGVRLDPSAKPLGKPALLLRGTKGAKFSISPVPQGGWLVVSHRSPPDPWGWGGSGAIRVVRVSAEGQPNPEALKEPANARETPPGWLDVGRDKKPGATWPWGDNACAPDGRRVLVVWQRHHLAGEKMTNLENSDLIAARVDGIISMDPAGVSLAASATEEKHPALASDGKGRLLLVYERQDEAGRTVRGRVITTR